MQKLLFVLVLLAGVAVQAQIPDAYYTNTVAKVLNGRFWMSISTNARGNFLVGFAEALLWYSDITAADPTIHEKNADNWPQEATYGDIERGVTKFYEEPENLSIPIIQAIKIFTMKVHSRSQAAIDSQVTFQRIISLGSSVQPTK